MLALVAGKSGALHGPVIIIEEYFCKVKGDVTQGILLVAQLQQSAVTPSLKSNRDKKHFSKQKSRFIDCVAFCLWQKKCLGG
jgi:hypothetical protein